MLAKMWNGFCQHSIKTQMEFGGSGRVMIEGGSVIRAGMVEKASPISVGNGFVWLRAFAHTGRDSSLPGGVLMVERGV